MGNGMMDAQFTQPHRVEIVHQEVEFIQHTFAEHLFRAKPCTV